MVGLRNTDPGEEQFIATHHVAIKRSTGELAAFLNVAEPVYVHIDYDVLDGARHIHARYSTPGGLGLEDLVQAIAVLRRGFTVAGISFTEYAPIGNGDIATIRALLGALQVPMIPASQM